MSTLRQGAPDAAWRPSGRAGFRLGRPDVVQIENSLLPGSLFSLAQRLLEKPVTAAPQTLSVSPRSLPMRTGDGEQLCFLAFSHSGPRGNTDRLLLVFPINGTIRYVLFFCLFGFFNSA